MKNHYKFSLPIIILLLIQMNATCQTKAVTEKGDTIFIYNNGTWSYELLEESPEVNEMSFLEAVIEIDTLTTPFSTPKSANKVLKNENNQFTIKYNDSLWKRVPPATLNDDAEFALQGKDADVWCVVISEETTIAKDMLLKIAKQTMEENTGSEAEILKTELRSVNGYDVIRGTLKANFSGINFIFDTYYYSDELGSVQFTTWTSDKLWERNQELILDLLNGFKVSDR